MTKQKGTEKDKPDRHRDTKRGGRARKGER